LVAAAACPSLRRWWPYPAARFGTRTAGIATLRRLSCQPR
jgi:hypothetical protein